MTYKWIGAMLVMAGCGGWGFSLAARQRQQERLLGQLGEILSFMSCELSYRLTPLPELCRQAGREAKGPVGRVFTALAARLDSLAAPEVSGCMKEVLRENRDLPPGIRRLLYRLGCTLGRFDLPGQMQGLSALQRECERERQRTSENREERLRSIRTLGLCAGAALVILFV